MSDNGHTPFAIGQGVPIVGQPFSIKGWLYQVLGTCNCSSRPEPVLIIGQPGHAIGACALCGRRYVLQGASMHGNQIQFEIGMQQPQPTPVPTGAVQ